MAFLIIRDLHFSQGIWHLEATVSIEQNTCAAIIGPSGAGKSTLLALVAGFERPVQGSISVDGEDITSLSPALRPVTILFQEHNLFAHLSLEQNIGLGCHPGLQLSTEDKEVVSDAITAVGLNGLERRLPDSVSGGERQRAALARCLCRNQPILLLDEPFNSLDPALRQEMRLLVDRLRHERHLTVLLVSHNPQEDAQISEIGIFMHSGRILEQNKMGTLLQHPETHELQQYLGRPDH